MSDQLQDALVYHFDGAAWPNPGGVATFGWVCLDGGREIAGEGGVAAKGAGATNNVAEYHGLGRALAHVGTLDRPPGQVIVRGDSQLVVYQMTGRWECRVSHLEKLRDRCRQMIDGLAALGWTIVLEWVPLDQNAVADGKSTAAWERETGRPFPDLKAKKLTRKR